MSNNNDDHNNDVDDYDDYDDDDDDDDDECNDNCNDNDDNNNDICYVISTPRNKHNHRYYNSTLRVLSASGGCTTGSSFWCDG